MFSTMIWLMNSHQKTPKYSSEPQDPSAFKTRFDAEYTRIAKLYDVVVRRTPFWRRWLDHALEHIEGPRVLEVSFGTGYLLTRYAGRVDAYGIDLNSRMLEIARGNLSRAGLEAELRQGDVEDLPYDDDEFDCLVNTMAFTGYPNGERAPTEITRVLKPEGTLVMIDVNYPPDMNRLGVTMTQLWARAGDLIRDMNTLLNEAGYDSTDRSIGGFGSIHLYVARPRG